MQWLLFLHQAEIKLKKNVGFFVCLIRDDISSFSPLFRNKILQTMEKSNSQV